MKKFVGLFLVGLISLISFSQPVGASVQDFTVNYFKANYYLSRDEDGHSKLTTVEKIIATFPEIDQNHGIERFLPINYDGHTTSIGLASIKNEEGIDWNYTTSYSDGNWVLRIGDVDKYLHGAQTFIITYVQKDVTKYFSNTNDDEFYWDVNGTGWSQPFDRIDAIVYLSDDLLTQISEGESCYYGVFGATNKCELNYNDEYGTYGVSVDNLKPGENMTIAIPFKAGTFTTYKMSPYDYLTRYANLICLALAILCLLLAVVGRVTVGRSAPGRGTIIPEYFPPRDSDVIVSSVISSKAGPWVAPLFVDLAVRRKIKIIELEKKLFKKQTYRVELLAVDELTDNERQFMKGIFGDDLLLGSTYEIDPNKTDYKFISLTSNLNGAVVKKLKTDGYYKNIKQYTIIAGVVIAIAFIMFIVSVFFLPKYNLFEILPGIDVVVYGFIFIILFFAVVIYGTTMPLSEKGRQLSDYIKGLEMYIKIAEEDRIKYLQSVTGAERIDTSDGEKMVKLYERVLPYAILLGLEKSWSKVLGNYYTEQNAQPDWYFGVSAFNATTFASSMSSFSSSSSQSSSSGGSGGGGSSGGGGGGGGGGGW